MLFPTAQEERIPRSTKTESVIYTPLHTKITQRERDRERETERGRGGEEERESKMQSSVHCLNYLMPPKRSRLTNLETAIAATFFHSAILVF